MDLSHAEIARLLGRRGDDLLAAADAARRRCCGDAVHVRGIIEFSSHCSRRCAYCGLRRDNAALPRYLMPADAIADVAADAAEQGVRTIVLQSGESDAWQPDWLADVVRRVKARADAAVTLCVGVRPLRDLRLWRQAGADRYLLKHETANPRLYEQLHPDSTLEERLAALARLRDLDYQVGTGNIIGLPGQSEHDLAADIVLARDLDVDMAAFGPFVPHADTPLADAPAGDIQRALRVVAAARLALGPVHIPATTAFDAIDPDGRRRALQAGANVLMANLTPPRYRDLYSIYPSNRAANSVARVQAILAELDRPLATDRGHSLKRQPAGPPAA